MPFRVIGQEATFAKTSPLQQRSAGKEKHWLGARATAAFVPDLSLLGVIGLDDKKQVLGLEYDYSTLNTRPNRDGFEQALRQTLIKAVGERCCARWIKVKFGSLQGKDLCKISISPATEPIYVKEKGADDTIYVRVGNATRPLKTREAVAYAGDRWALPDCAVCIFLVLLRIRPARYSGCY